MEVGGTLGNGRYVVRGVLGEGAQGKTFDAVDAHGRPVAIKRFDVRGAKGWKDVELAEREVRVLATIDHPLVPRYVESFEEDGGLYLVMEKVEGETLEAIRKRDGAMGEDEVRRFLADADRALTYLHGRASPIVHRDIKPRNVVRRPNGSYVLVDFGAVRELLARGTGGSTVVGTMGFMAPEQFQGRALPVTDVYAVGATALAMLTGADPDTLPHQGLRVDVRSAVGQRVSPAMASSLEHMLDPDPERRAQSLGVALDGVRASGAPMTPSVPPATAGGALVHRPAKEPTDAAVKSVKRLLWTLWGLGWIAVPVTLAQLNIGSGTPFVMFSSLLLIVILTWHEGAAIRAILRRLGHAGGGVQPSAPTSEPVRARVDIGPAANVRVHTTEVQPDAHAATERTSTTAKAAERARIR